MAHRKASDAASKYKVKQVNGIDRIFLDYDISNKLDLAPFKICNKFIWDSYRKGKQGKHEIAYKKQIWKMLSYVLQPYFPTGYLAIGGSTLNSFGTHKSDLDLCLSIKCNGKEIYNEDIALCALRRAKNVLEKQLFVSSISLVNARVPILKLDLNFPYNHVEVDMNCNCVAGIFNTHLLSYYGRLDERVPAMACFLKDWAKRERVIDPKFGGVNSYSIMLMVIHFLQCAVEPPILPSLIHLYPDMFDGSGLVEDLDYDKDLCLPDIPKNGRSIAELVYGFLNYYTQFDYENRGISIRDACLIDRKQRPKEDGRFLFFLEEAYDGMTVPKNLVKKHKLARIISALEEARNRVLFEIVGAMLPVHLRYENHEYELNM